MSIEYIFCGFVFNIFPIILYAFGIQRNEWLLPSELKILFIDSKSHPGYEINYLFCVYYINYLCFICAG